MLPMQGYIDNHSTMPQFWTPGKNNSMSIRILKDSSGNHYQLRRGGRQPDWAKVCVIDPETFEPIYGLAAFGHKQHQETGAMTTKTSPFNIIDKERYKTFVRVSEFKELPRFTVETPHFTFDSHGNTEGWHLDVRQRWYGTSPGKLSIKLFHGKYQDGEGIRIRIAQQAVNKRIECLADVAELFDHDAVFIHSGKVSQMPRHNDSALVRRVRELELEVAHLDRELANSMSPKVTSLDDFSDEELLAELNQRVMNRLDGYRGPRPQKPLLDNVIDIDSIKKVQYDDTKIMQLLAA